MKINQFLESIEGLASNTKRVYKQSLWQLHSASTGDEPTDEEVAAFLNKYKASTLQRHKAAIKAYLEFLGRPWPFPSRLFRRPRQRLPRFIQPDLVRQMAQSTQNIDEHMFVLTLFNLGCRISELLQIKVGDITPAGAKVITKGGNQKLKVMTSQFYQELSTYAKGKKGRVFPSSYDYYRKVLKRLGTQYGHPEITPHMLRHSRAVDLKRKGVDLSTIQQFLDHVSISTTAIYLEIDREDVTKEIEEAEAKFLNERIKGE